MKKPAFILFAFTAFLINAESALACQCISPPINTEGEFRSSVAAALNGANAVFSGEVTEMDRLTMKFKVQKVWKGEFKDEFTLITGTVMTEDGLYISSRCDHQFELGESYLVFADGSNNRLKAAHCSWTGILGNAERVVGELDRLNQIETVSPLPNSEADVDSFFLM
jgi:hypothetical protein